MSTSTATHHGSHSCLSRRVRLATRHSTAFIDLTAELEHLVSAAHIRTGTLTVQSLHTTTALVVNEREPLLLADFQAVLSRLAPRSSIYHHDDMAKRADVPLDEPPNGHAHCRALLLPTSLSLTVVDGQLTLGRWQRVFFVELDGPREREVSVVILGEVSQ